MTSNKNIGAFLVFNLTWFRKHQRLLLYLLNSPLTRRLTRWVLRIRSYDCPLSEKIVAIGPNFFTKEFKWLNDNLVEATTDFRTHPKYAKRIYYAFRSLWWLCHAWDWLIADRFLPELSFGFDSLTAYPDPNPETTTVDGQVGYSAEYQTWTYVRDKTSGSTNPSAATGYVVQGEKLSNDYDYHGISRCVFLFDTHLLTSGANISAAVFSVMSGVDCDLTETANPANLALVSSNPASNTNLVGADYNKANWGTTRFATDYTAAAFWANRNNYSNMSLNASGIANINKAGISKFGIRASNDLDNNAPIHRSFVIGYFADYTGTSNDPKLVVTYTISAGAKVPWWLFNQAALGQGVA